MNRFRPVRRFLDFWKVGKHATTARTALGALLPLMVCAAGLAFPVQAQNFPTKPIRAILPAGPIGVNDFAARMYAERMTSILGQLVFIENKGGGSGIPAMNDVLNSTADGHTIFIAD